MYVHFLSHDVGKRGYAQMFRELLALPEGTSLLFHCTQGKDRTGCAAMLILSALGVDEETIMADYMLTNEFNADLIAEQRQQLLDAGVAEEDLDGIMIVRDQVFPQTMRNALDWMKENYGSVRGYITQELGVTDAEIAQLQDKFLE
jgi:protein-tyrosine phosphatase